MLGEGKIDSNSEVNEALKQLLNAHKSFLGEMKEMKSEMKRLKFVTQKNEVDVQPCLL